MIEITNNYKTFTDLNPIYPDIIICQHMDEEGRNRIDLKTQLRIYRNNKWYKNIYRTTTTPPLSIVESIDKFIEQIYRGQIYSENLEDYCKPDIVQISEQDRIRRDYDTSNQTKSS